MECPTGERPRGCPVWCGCNGSGVRDSGNRRIGEGDAEGDIGRRPVEISDGNLRGAALTGRYGGSGCDNRLFEHSRDHGVHVAFGIGAEGGFDFLHPG